MSSDDVPPAAWGGIYAAIQTRIDDGSFGAKYPENCLDQPCG